jgi:small subunit ribosomal protein S9
MTEQKTKRKRKAKGITAKAKKKEATARAVIREGTGKVRINKRLLDYWEPKQVREFVQEPLLIAGDYAKKANISIEVHGGGFMSQAVAARACIAKCLVSFSKDEKLKRDFLEYDRMLLVDDVRRKESKKQLGIGARRKKQKSKR